MADAKRYRAFISYSQKDKAEARKLQSWLETYRAPRTLAGRTGPGGRLGRFFRDEEDLSGAADLGEALKQNIDASESLIVLCSPHSARSQWVDREIQHFRSTGRGGKVFAVILSGEPNSADPALECFPPSFRTRGASHDPSAMPIEPLAVNLAADGRERACTRLAASLIEAPFDDLWRRERRRQQRRTAFAGGLFVTGLGLLAAAVVAGWFAVENLNEAERQGALAARRNSDIFAREAKELGDNTQHEMAMLMALHGDPAAQRSDVARRFDGATGYPRARAILAYATNNSRLERILPAKGIKPAVYSADGSRIAVTLGKTAKIWDAATGKPILTLSDEDGFDSVAFSPDGARLFTTRSWMARVWDIATGKELLSLDNSAPFSSGAFSSDGKRLITSSGSYHDPSKPSARIWDAATGHLLLELFGHTDSVETAVFSKNMKRVVTASSDSTARIWDAVTGQSLAILRHESTVDSAVFSPDGLRVITASGNVVRAWDANNGKELWTGSGHSDLVLNASVSPDGRSVVTASVDGTAWIWDAETGAALISLSGHSGSVRGASFSPDGKHALTVADDDALRIWRAQFYPENIAIPNEEGPIFSSSFSLDGSLVVTAGAKSARISEAKTGKTIASLQGHEGRVNSAVFSSDGSRILTASNDKTARIWNAVDGKPVLVLSGHSSAVISASFSADGSRIVTASADRTARIWDANTGVTIRTLSAATGKDASVTSASFSPDGSRIVTSAGVWQALGRSPTTVWQATIWDAEKGAALLSLPHENPVRAASFSPDGASVVTASDNGRVWDATTGKLTSTLDYLGTNHAAFSRDGTQIVTSSDAGWATVWDISTAQPVFFVNWPERVFMADTSAFFAPDGARFITVSGGTARIWTIPEIVRAGAQRQVEIACTKLWKTGLRLAFKQDHAQAFPILQGEPVDPETGDLVSPCKGVLPEEAFVRAAPVAGQ